MEAVRDIRRTWSRYKTKIIAVTADAVSRARLLRAPAACAARRQPAGSCTYCTTHV